MPTDALVLSHVIRREAGRWVYRGDRPAPDCHAHGFTPKTLTLLHGLRLVDVVVYKQRWLWSDGHTTHDRPPQDVSWSRYGLLVVFTTLRLWLEAPKGLLKVMWGWMPDRPDARSVQRWWRRLRPDALRWHQAIRAAVVDALAPRPLEEMFPAGLPPPGGLSRFSGDAVLQAWQLHSGLTTLLDANHPQRSSTALLVEARRRLELQEHH